MPRKTLDALSYSMVDLFEDDDGEATDLFHESTKLHRHNRHVVGDRVGAIAQDPALCLMMTRAWKTYAGYPRAPLPDAHVPDVALSDVLLRRRSAKRGFRDGAIALGALGALLRAAYGPTHTFEVRGNPGERAFLRAAPSAGGLYPLELYPIALDVEGCARGVYHYGVGDHTLTCVAPGDARAALLDAVSYPDVIGTAAAIVAITAVLPRTLAKYRFRGYRFALHDVGALLQNLYLVGTALGLGTCAVGGFYDDEVARVLDVDSVDEQVMLLFAIGREAAP